MKKLIDEVIYFDNSATTYVKPETVYEKMYSVMKFAGGNAGRGGHIMADRASDVIFNTRILASDFFNISSPEEVCFVSNASMGLNFAIKSVLKPGDHVIISPYEHNSVLRPLHKLLQKNISYSIANCNANGDFEDLENDIRQETKMIIINHVSNVNGRVADINKIGKITKKHNIIFMVDASQSAGHLEIDVQKNNIDILVCSGHKGLYGPQGTGVMYINHRLKTDTVFEGGSGSMSEMLVQPDIMPDKFEIGTQNTPGIGGLGEGIKFINDIGIKTILNHEHELAEMMINGLATIGKITMYSHNVQQNTGVVSFNIKDRDSVEIANILSEKYDVAVRGGLHCSYLAHKTLGTVKTGCIRASLGYFNTKTEVEKFLNIIDRL